MTESVETRHRAALELDPKTPKAVSRFLGLMGDPSWRVRKAALSRLPSFTDRPTLLVDLIAGLAHDTNAGLRSACAEALLQLGWAIEPLIAALHTTNANQRKIVAEILGQIGTPAAREKLLEALDDPDPNARTAVAEALGNIGGDEVVAELSRRLMSASDDLHESAYLLDALGRAGARLPFDELEPWIGRREMVRQVFPLLGFSGDPRVIDPLLVGLSTESWGTRGAAIQALDLLISRLDPGGADLLRGRLTGEGARREILIAAMDQESDDLGEAAVRLLGFLGEADLAPAILKASASRRFLKAGLEAVQSFGAAAIASLLTALHDVDTDTRVLGLEVIETLGDTGADDMLESCVEIATADEPRAAEAAIRILGRHGGPEVVGTLIGVLERGDADLADQTALALTQIAGRHPDTVANQAAERLTAGNLHWAWPYVLGEVGRPADLEVILAATADDDVEVRLTALQAAAAFGDEVDLTIFTSAATDPLPRIRAAALRALGAYRVDVAHEILVAALSDADPWVVAEAIRSLGIGGWQRAVPAIESAAARRDTPIAVAALRSLSRLEPVGLEPVIRAALSHPEPEVVREALNATDLLSDAVAREILLSTMTHDSWDVRRGSVAVLAARGLPVPKKLVQDHLATETEPLVQRSLRHLLARVEESETGGTA